MREPNEISEDEYIDRIQRDPARWERIHDVADLIHDRQVEDALIDDNGDVYKVVDISTFTDAGAELA